MKIDISDTVNGEPLGRQGTGLPNHPSTCSGRTEQSYFHSNDNREGIRVLYFAQSGKGFPLPAQ